MKRFRNSSDSVLSFTSMSSCSPTESKHCEAMLHSLDGDSKKRRLSSSQVTALENHFEADNKLEPERKAKLAVELGMRPRQVAIWFQNRRARCKNKQLEKKYEILKSSYEELKFSCENVSKENEALKTELRDLKTKLEQARFSESENNVSTSGESNSNKMNTIAHRDSASYQNENVINQTWSSSCVSNLPQGLNLFQNVYGVVGDEALAEPNWFNY
ncbi:unnamed protein product [Rhodiola kirilowii]